VSNPEHVQTGVKQITFDGEPVDDMMIPLVGDCSEHIVKVILGRESGND
jgi:hypothetical protein